MLTCAMRAIAQNELNLRAKQPRYYVASSLASRDGTHAHCSMNIKYSVYSRAATITPDGRYVRRLFEGGYYSKCGVYSRK